MPAAPGTALAVEAVGLVKQYTGRSGVVDAVRGVDLAVRTGEVFGFLGPNGAGKSTTVKMLTTLLSITSGTARVAGIDVAAEPDAARRCMGVALQEAGLDVRQTGRELLVLQGRLFDLNKEQAEQRAEQLLTLVELNDAADRRIKGYSGGMKRRLDLALALVHGPRVLFLDEPTTGLDPQSRAALWEEVGRLARNEGVTVFLTTQYLEEADVLADRVGIIDHGRIVAEGTPEELKAEIGCSTVEALPAEPAEQGAVAAVLERFGIRTHGFSPGTVAVQLATADGNLADIVRALDGERLHIAHLQIHEPTLDDVFLAKTGRHLEGSGDGAGSQAVARERA
jgi:ABC-2 type transport system ATP-binding protein